MVQEQLINYSTAKLAKEKGFNLPTNYYYDKIGLEKGDGDCEFIYLNHNAFDGLYSAPTQTELQKWLREIHNIIVYAIPSIEDRKKWYCRAQNNESHYIKVDGLDSYEKAIEAGLIAGLTLIK